MSVIGNTLRAVQLSLLTSAIYTLKTDPASFFTQENAVALGSGVVGGLIASRFIERDPNTCCCCRLTRLCTAGFYGFTGGMIAGSMGVAAMRALEGAETTGIQRVVEKLTGPFAYTLNISSVVGGVAGFVTATALEVVKSCCCCLRRRR